MSLGLFSPVDAMQELDPDLSREDAIKRLIRVQSDMAEYAQGYIKDPTLDSFKTNSVNFSRSLKDFL